MSTPSTTGREPTHGWIDSHPIHAFTHHYLPDATRIQRFNALAAISTTRVVGTMWMAYAFCALSFYGLPAALHGAGTFVQWASSQFIQLVLLPVIIVGQDVQAKASDARAAKTLSDAEAIMDALNLETEGGLKAILDAIKAL